MGSKANTQAALFHWETGLCPLRVRKIDVYHRAQTLFESCIKLQQKRVTEARTGPQDVHQSRSTQRVAQDGQSIVGGQQFEARSGPPEIRQTTGKSVIHSASRGERGAK